MPTFPLTIVAGKHAAATIAEKGWDPAIFSSLVGASGGAKLLGLGHLDRYLFGHYLQRSSQPMHLYGSSIGSWRHAALAAPDPLQAITALQDRYLNQPWSEDDSRSPSEIVDELCAWVLEGVLEGVLDGVLQQETCNAICSNPRFTTHIVTARGLGFNQSLRKPAIATGMAVAAISNAINRRWLSRSFQRTVFSSGPSLGFEFKDFDTTHVTLTQENLRQALLASGSIPFLMSGQRDISGAPPGHYWDGGIIDYHFDFANATDRGLILYPHFTDRVIKGWFDKALPWRQYNNGPLDNVVLIAPSAEYIASLPYGKIPDRKDFQRFSTDNRLQHWREAINRSRELADAFDKVVNATDPLARVSVFLQ